MRQILHWNLGHGRWWIGASESLVLCYDLLTVWRYSTYTLHWVFLFCYILCPLYLTVDLISILSFKMRELAWEDYRRFCSDIGLLCGSSGFGIWMYFLKFQCHFWPYSLCFHFPTWHVQMHYSQLSYTKPVQLSPSKFDCPLYSTWRTHILGRSGSYLPQLFCVCTDHLETGSQVNWSEWC